MGMDLTVDYPSGNLPSWTVARELLATAGFAVQVKMIDGQLAFPDEEPPESWQELRVGTPHGMVTLRRGRDRIVCVIWGNADAALVQAWHALAWACAASGDGQVGGLSASEFRRSADLPTSLRGGT